MSSNTYLPSCESLQIEKEKKEERKKEKKRIEHKPNWTLLTSDIMQKYYANN